MSHKITLLIIIFSLFSCSENTGEEFKTACGAVIEETLENPVFENDGISVNITAISPGPLITVRDSDGIAQLVSLQGLEIDSEISNQNAVNFLFSLGREVTFIRAKEDCLSDVTLEDMSRVDTVPGQILATNGLSFSEELLKRNLARVADRNSGDCDGDLITNCLSGVSLEGQ